IKGLGIVSGRFIIGGFRGIMHERRVVGIGVIRGVSGSRVLVMMSMVKGRLGRIVIGIFI
uniref:hypothetical protein n=1 Tax=Priestia megaterium TaxID=1404 RepID=UPI0039A07DC4